MRICSIHFSISSYLPRHLHTANNYELCQKVVRNMQISVVHLVQLLALCRALSLRAYSLCSHYFLQSPSRRIPSRTDATKLYFNKNSQTANPETNICRKYRRRRCLCSAPNHMPPGAFTRNVRSFMDRIVIAHRIITTTSTQQQKSTQVHMAGV